MGAGGGQRACQLVRNVGQFVDGGLDAQARIFLGNEAESDEFSTSLTGLAPTGLNYQLSGRASDQTYPSADPA